jgi:hypothetical protein
MRLRIDIRIDADRNVGSAGFGGSDRGKKLQLGFRFDVDAEDALFDRQRQFARGLADP